MSLCMYFRLLNIFSVILTAVVIASPPSTIWRRIRSCMLGHVRRSVQNVERDSQQCANWIYIWKNMMVLRKHTSKSVQNLHAKSMPESRCSMFWVVNSKIYDLLRLEIAKFTDFCFSSDESHEIIWCGKMLFHVFNAVEGFVGNALLDWSVLYVIRHVIFPFLGGNPLF